MFLRTISFLTVCSVLNLNIFATTPLERGKNVPVRITSDVNSKRLKKATITAIVDANIKSADGKILIKSGTPVELQASGKKAKGCGRPGYITMSCISTTAADGQKIMLNGNLSAEGDARRGLALGLGLGFGLTCVLPVIGLSLLAIKGKNATIPSNTIMNYVYVTSDYMVE